MEYVREVIHDATQILSDHHPLLIRMAMQPVARSGLKKLSYFKLDVLGLEVDSIREAIKLVWNKHMKNDRDPRVNWELGWKAIRKKLRSGRKEKHWKRIALARRIDFSNSGLKLVTHRKLTSFNSLRTWRTKSEGERDLVPICGAIEAV